MPEDYEYRDQSRDQASQNGQSTAKLVELLTSVLEQVKQQQVQVNPRAAAPLGEQAQLAVEIFREISIALDVRPGSFQGGGSASPVNTQEGRN
jgi:hypothetical protein